MTNKDLTKIFYEISTLLMMDGVAFKPQAYERAALSIESLSESIEDIYKKTGGSGIEKIPGVGKSIAGKIIEYLETGKIKYYLDLRRKMPVDIGELMAIEGVGPQMIKDFWKYLKIKDVNSLEKAARAGKIRKLPNYGEKTENNILQGIEFFRKSTGKFLLGDILPMASEITSKLRNIEGVEKISPAGSLRRMKEVIGDIDILVVVKKEYSAKKIMDYFTSMPGVIKTWGRGATKSSVRLDFGIDVDLRIISLGSFGSALQYFTGSKEHNIELRKIAIEKGFKLNEYGLFKGKKKIFSPAEKDIYRALGLEYIEPELREGTGEIKAAVLQKKDKISLPKPVSLNEIKGDLHCHSNWDGGENSILEMAEAAMKIGYEYIGIADHTKFLKIENGLNEERLLKQRKEINKLNSEFEDKKIKFRILQGCEANIMADGSIDIKDEVLSVLDYVIAGVHSQMKMSKEKMTERIIRAIHNPNVDIISHPTGRILKKRDEYRVDFEKVLEEAKKTKTILEINAHPERLDLNDKNIRKAKNVGVKMIVNTDSHEKTQLKLIEFGVAQARRGWAEKKDIINTNSLEKLQTYFNAQK